MIQLFKRSNQSIVLLVLLIAGFSLIGTTVSTYAQQPSPTLIYVSAGGSNTSGNGSMANPYATIQYAANVAPPHAVIIVEPGTYNEMINVTKPLTIESASLQPANTVINAIGQVYGIEIIGQNASGTVIDGLTVEHANNHGIFVQDSSHVTIEDNYVIYNGLNASQGIAENKGLELSGTSYSTAVNNFVANNMADGGIGVSDEGAINPGGLSPGIPAPALGNIISGNVVTGNTVGCGIVVAAYNPGEGVIGNVVSNNLVYNGLPGGIVVAADVPGTLAANNTVSYNTVLNNLIPGIIVHSNTPGDVVTGTQIIGNTISGNAGFGPQTTGITIIGNINGATIATDTVISGNIIHNEFFGVLALNATGTQVYSNNLFDSTVNVPVQGAALSSVTLGSLSSEQSSLQSSLSSLQSALNSLQGSNSQLQSTVSSLQSSAATTSQVNSLSSSLGTTTDVAYLSLIVALVLGIIAIALALRRK
ncbi:MAG: right-handed parallel beta-helix repeat-containing protein [Nitrososphaerota archaeon]|nr:right-handed parallel beta-helix repeat-containing protein [Nitrososphaerota archaeon]